MAMSTRRQSRRVFMCTECHKAFRTREELYMHAELCLLEAFELEASQMLADMPSLSEGAEAAGPPPGLTITPDVRAAKEEGADPPHLRLEKPREEAPKAAARDAQGTRTIQTAKGLKLMVSVERPEDAGLAAEIDSLDEGDLDEEELAALADEDVSLPPGASPPKRRAPNVILGALANGTEEDMYKPKMECPTCGLVLYRHNFSTHYRIHTGEMPFHCTYCEKRFRTTSALKVHVRAHTGEKPYVCPRCNYACITKRNLDRHIINNHVREGTRRGPRYRRSRYRLSDPHHEEYLISMSGGAAQYGEHEGMEEEEEEELTEQDLRDPSMRHHLYQQQQPPPQHIILAGQHHEEVSVEIEVNQGKDQVEVVDEEVEVGTEDGPPLLDPATDADSPRRSGRSRIPTAKTAS